MADHDDMKVFAFVLVAAILEASGDAILRLALHHQSLPSRVGLFLLGVNTPGALWHLAKSRARRFCHSDRSLCRHRVRHLSTE